MSLQSRYTDLRNPRFIGSLVMSVTVGVSGCAGLGSGAIQGSRTDYNVAIRQTESEQLLLNLVRLRYRDQVLFLETASLTTQFTFGGSLAASYGYSSEARENSVVGGRAFIEEKPTVTYTPMQGKVFVERFLDRISMDTLVLLSGAGWSSDRVFRVCVEKMNRLNNAPRADGPTPKRAPDYEQFQRASRLLRELQLKDMFAGARVPGEATSVLRFRAAAAALPEFQEFTEILGLDPDRHVFAIESSVDRPDGKTLNLRTRSFVGVMYFLSQSVQVPAADIEAGRVTVTRDPSGEIFDWTRVTEGLMKIHSSNDRPDNAAVAVPYRGSWFFIDDSDLDSKSTFLMLGQIFALQSGDVETSAPVLTIPVG